MLPLSSEHLGCERWRQVLVLHVVSIDGRNCVTANRQRVFFQDVLHLPLHILLPGEEVPLQALSGLHQNLLPLPETWHHLQVVVELSDNRVGDSRSVCWVSRGPSSLCAVKLWWGLARHVALKLFWGQVERLSIQLLDEGHCTTLNKHRVQRRWVWPSFTQLGSTHTLLPHINKFLLRHKKKSNQSLFQDGQSDTTHLYPSSTMLSQQVSWLFCWFFKGPAARSRFCTN